MLQKLAIFFVICLMVLPLTAEPWSRHQLDPYNPEYKEGEILVMFKDNVDISISKNRGELSVGLSSVDELLQKWNATDANKLFSQSSRRTEKKFMKAYDGSVFEVRQMFNIYKLRLPQNTDIKQLITELNEDKNIEFAEPNYLFYSMEIEADDPMSNQQWYLDTVNAPLAWQETTGSDTQIIAIIDTGVDWTHPDLADKIWINPNELEENGMDNDGNGYINDIRGWDFVNNDNNPMDDNSHGTHVAGIAAAGTNNGIGISGIDWNARIMPLKVLQSSGSGSSSDIALAVDYARVNGATVINMSLGSYGESHVLKIALENAYAFTTIVAAAGNNGYKVDPTLSPWPPYAPMFPACYSFVIGVQASTPSGDLAGFSNFDPSGPVGSGNIFGHNYEITAPGTGIYSTFPNGGYRALNGTSMAAPIVAGAVSLIKSIDAEQSNEQIFAKLIQSADPKACEIAGNLIYYGVLDIANFFNYELSPQLSFVKYTLVDDLPGCDNDGIADAGETIHLYLTVKNSGGQAVNVTSSLSFAEFEDTSVATIINNTSNIGDIATYASMTGVQNPFIISISPDVANNRDIVFQYEISADNHETVSGTLIIKVQNGYEIGGVLTEDTVFTPDKEYILTSNLRISSGVTLTILPGTTIKFNPGMSIDIRGNLIANGTPDNMIIFTRNQEEYGGGFRSSSVPANIEISYAVIEYMYVPQRFDANRDGSININNSIVRYSGRQSDYFIHFFQNSLIDFSNNVIYSNFGVNLIWYNYSFNMQHNSFINNRSNFLNETLTIQEQSTDNIKNNNFFSNYLYGSNNEINLALGGGADYVDISQNYWGRENLASIQSSIYDFQIGASLPAALISPILTQPSAESHGIVWKVEINDTETNIFDNPYHSASGLGVIGSETIQFKVYFNRPMNPVYQPFLTFGVREPYTQNVVQDNSEWNEDYTVWTAYYTVGLNTGDGIQRVRVASARDMENFEIPIERNRFEFVIQAAGAQSANFQALAGIGKVDLEWPAAELDDILGYNMYRFENITDSTFTEPVIINANLIVDSVYVDYAVIPYNTYYYKYKAVRTDMQESDFSKVVSATPFNATPGDANGDLAVNVLDITTIVSYLLNQNPQPFLFDGADANQDGNVNVLDIVQIVNLMNGRSVIATVNDNQLMPKLNTSAESVSLQFAQGISALQLSFKGLGLSPATRILPGNAVKGMEFSYQINEDKIDIVIYSMSNKVLSSQFTDLFSIVNGKISSVEYVLASDNAGNEIEIDKSGSEEIVPVNFFVNNNYPNPFNPETRIDYGINEISDVTFSVYNVKGQKVSEIRESQKQPGIHYFIWKGTDQNQKNVASGVYFYKIKAGRNEKVGKMLLLK
jgi:subtilisin family serine protease